ncbi:MAG: GNAT family N-acetyltransferase [Candidatus Marinimicrobia bacterium]|nr:GNAT family N-acetyltransferase [Candidatus Neomarinimicrobiota bacterium]
MIQRIHNNSKDKALLKSFLDRAGKSLEKFRYYSSRSFDSIDQHIYTILVIDDLNIPVAYGHLDKEDENVWLGICVSAEHSGQGYGKLVMQDLLRWAQKNGIRVVRLKVDYDNSLAIDLYKKHGFEVEQIVIDQHYYMLLKLQ